MIIKEHFMTRYDGVELFRSYSDEGVYIRKIDTDTVYAEAIDVESAPYKYEETDMPLDEPFADDTTESDYINALKELGVTFGE